MLLSRQQREMDFGGARFDLSREQDRVFLGWVFNQFLYGEVTGIQCGYWLFHAPTLNAAQFLSRQATEELAHVRKILRIISILKVSPSPAHPVIRFLSTGMMGGSWAEHVAIEMALGEGLVLNVFYVLSQTLSHEPEIHKLLEQAIADEEKHVVFGEIETRSVIEGQPGLIVLLRGLALVQWLALGVLGRFVRRWIAKQGADDHPVLGRFGEFVRFVQNGVEDHCLKLGIISKRFKEVGFLTRINWVVGIPFRQLRFRFRHKSRKLTATYLKDPLVRLESVVREGRTPS